ncbi:MAG: exodeoxyribonuclease VII large subunit, partial [Pseudomonadota bacterium]
EERRKRLAAEGLFDEGRKRPLPFLPTVIGVVTSPTGAVIRDILHRLEDRFPRHVLLWPVVVQGEAAPGQIAAAIDGFGGLAAQGAVPRPDVLIVGRGGGSLEDLMAFNEESVVRAVAACTIPIISAVGHETDTTLIDFAADRRAPTPTAAAEMAVPVRADLIADVMDKERRLFSATTRALNEREVLVQGLGRGLGDPARLIDYSLQRLDDRVTRWQRALEERLGRLGDRLEALRPRHPSDRLQTQASALATASDRLTVAAKGALATADRAYANSAGRLRMQPLERRLAEGQRDLGRLEVPLPRLLTDGEVTLAGLAQMLNSLSYERVLDRGFAVVRDGAGSPVADAAAIKSGDALSLQLRDGTVEAVAAGKPAKRASKAKPAPSQGDLF